MRSRIIAFAALASVALAVILLIWNSGLEAPTSGIPTRTSQPSAVAPRLPSNNSTTVEEVEKPDLIFDDALPSDLAEEDYPVVGRRVPLRISYLKRDGHGLQGGASRHLLGLSESGWSVFPGPGNGQQAVSSLWTVPEEMRFVIPWPSGFGSWEPRIVDLAETKNRNVRLQAIDSARLVLNYDSRVGHHIFLVNDEGLIVGRSAHTNDKPETLYGIPATKCWLVLMPLRRPKVAVVQALDLTRGGTHHINVTWEDSQPLRIRMRNRRSDFTDLMVRLELAGEDVPSLPNRTGGRADRKFWLTREAEIVSASPFEIPAPMSGVLDTHHLSKGFLRILVFRDDQELANEVIPFGLKEIEIELPDNSMRGSFSLVAEQPLAKASFVAVRQLEGGYERQFERVDLPCVVGDLLPGQYIYYIRASSGESVATGEVTVKAGFHQTLQVRFIEGATILCSYDMDGPPMNAVNFAFADSPYGKVVIEAEYPGNRFAYRGLCPGSYTVSFPMSHSSPAVSVNLRSGQVLDLGTIVEERK